MQPMYWKCQDCEEVFPDDNWGTKYMTEEDLKKAREEIMLAGPQEPKPLLGLSVYELPGIGVSNTKALTRLTISKD